MALLCTVMVTAHAAKIVQTLNAPANKVTGLAFDGQNLWASSQEPDSLYKLNPLTGAVVGSWKNSAEEAATRNITGVGFAGNSIYVGMDAQSAVRAGIYRYTTAGEYKHFCHFLT